MEEKKSIEERTRAEEKTCIEEKPRAEEKTRAEDKKQAEGALQHPHGMVNFPSMINRTMHGVVSTPFELPRKWLERPIRTTLKATCATPRLVGTFLLTMADTTRNLTKFDCITSSIIIGFLVLNVTRLVSIAGSKAGLIEDEDATMSLLGVLAGLEQTDPDFPTLKDQQGVDVKCPRAKPSRRNVDCTTACRRRSTSRRLE